MQEVSYYKPKEEKDDDGASHHLPFKEVQEGTLWFASSHPSRHHESYYIRYSNCKKEIIGDGF